jgi:predicted dinucleotide-binding enzyme
MTYAIVGSGNIGRALAHQFARKRIEVRVANSRGPEQVAQLRQDLGDSVIPATVDEALAADIVIMAVPNPAVPEIAGRVPDWDGRILVDVTNAINFDDFSPKDLGGRLSTDIIADAVPTARVVKAFNTLPAAVLEAEPAQGSGKRVIFLSGSAPEARSEVAQLTTDLGFAPIDLGRVDQGGAVAQFGGPLALQNLIKQD